MDYFSMRYFYRGCFRFLLLACVLLTPLSSVANAGELFDSRLKKYITGEAKHSSKFGEQGIAYLRNRENLNHVINAFIFDTYIAPDRLHLLTEYNATLGAIENQKNDILDSIEDVFASVDGFIDIITSTADAVKQGKPPTDLIYLVSARLSTAVVEVNVPHKLPSSTELAVDALLVCVNDLAEVPVTFVSESEILPLLQDCVLEIHNTAVSDGVGSVLNRYLSKETSESLGAFSGDMVQILAECALASNKAERLECMWSGISQGAVWGSELVFNVLALMEIKDREFDLITKLAVYELLELSVKFGLGGRNQIARSYLGMPLTDGLPSFYGPALTKANEVFGNPVVAEYAKNTQLPIGGGTVFSTFSFEERFNSIFLSVSKNFNNIKSNLSLLPPTLPDLRNASGDFSLGNTILLAATSYTYSPNSVVYEWYKVGDSSPFFTESPAIGTPSRVRVTPSDYRSRYKVVAKTDRGAAVTGHKTVIALPNLPVLLSPSNQTEVPSDRDFKLRFTSVEGAYSYSVQIFDQTLTKWEFVARAISADSCADGVCEVVAQGMPEQSSAAWRVVALNEEHAGNWTRAAFFDIKPLPPAVPVLLSPSTGSEIAAGQRIDLTFTAAAGAQSYSIQVFDRTQREWVFVARNLAAEQYCNEKQCDATVAGLPQQTQAGWRVIAINDAGSSGWSRGVYFDVAPAPPSKPTLLVPSSGSVVTANQPIALRFSLPDGAKNYSVQVFDRTQSSWIFVARNVSSDNCAGGICELTVAGLPEQDQAAWRAVAINESGTSDWTPGVFFDVRAAAPIPLAPVNNQNLQANESIMLSFTAAPDAARYHVQVYDKTIRQWGSSNAWVTTNNCSSNVCRVQTPGLAVQDGTVWRVRSLSQSRWGEWSASAVFNVIDVHSKVAVGLNATCVVREQGYVACMGGGLNATQVPTDLVNPRSVSVGIHHACALDDTGVRCWGINIFGVLDVPPLQNPIAISSGDYHVCAIDQTGPVCWGSSYPFPWNQISGLPQYASLANFDSIDSASGRTCILADGQLECIGQTPRSGSNPVAQPNLIQPLIISVALDAACALDFFGVVCWGNGIWGHPEVPQLVNPTMVTTGSNHACALDAAGVVCWGRNSSSQTNVPHLVNPISITSANDHTCAVDDTGVVCWGSFNHRFSR